MIISMDKLDRAFDAARKDLRAVGLLDDGVYLDQIDCVRSPMPSFSVFGYVFDGKLPWIAARIGFTEGTIYIPSITPAQKYFPGQTLTDTIRHEFAHAWYWVEPSFVNGPWFRDTFGAGYRARVEFEYDPDEHVSPYAATMPKEDFAETFMYFLRYRKSLSQFKSRKGLYRKLKAIEKRVRQARRELGL